MMRWLDKRTGGADTTPLALLFLLNLLDELDQAALGALAPDIRDTFGVSDSTLILIATIAGALVISLIVPIGVWADRHNRVKMTVFAAVAWASMSALTGVAGFVKFLPLLVLARVGSGFGRVMNEPVHASLLADYYAPPTHAQVYGFHRMANPIGGLMVLVGGLLGAIFGWQLTFILLAIPTVIVIGMLSRLKEPARGASINAGLATEAEEAGQRVPMGEAFRRLSGIRTLKRYWIAAFFLGAAVIPINTISSFFFEQEFGIDSPGPWGLAGCISIYVLGAWVGIEIGSRRATRALMAAETPRLARLSGEALVGSGAALILMAISPWLPLSLAFFFLVGVTGGQFIPSYLPLVAAVAPPRLRSQAFAWFGLWFAVGAIVVATMVGGIGEESGYRIGMSVLAIGVVISGLICATAQQFVRRDADQAYNSLTTELDLRRELEQQGGRALLTCKGVEVAYDQVQVLFGVDMEVRPGEIVALLGTNGAGKSTLLKAISGTVDPIGGAIFFEGRDVTHADGAQTARMGIVQVPGGKAVFPTLTVAEHLRAAGWLYRDDPEYLKQANEEVLTLFPRLRERVDQMAGNLSGGEQQMLALGMAFIAKPKLLMIDELSLGLAPTIVEQLLDVVRKIQDQGTAIILVEQSINVALTVAERAYFMEKGEVRFEGNTAELLERDDIVRSVFLEGASKATGQKKQTVAPTARREAPTELRPVLEVNGLVKRFGGIRAVNDTTFVLNDGEILGLIGPNGAGKTTIFDLISGFLMPDIGRITLEDTDITRMPPDRRAWMGLGRSFQDARLVPSLTVAENLAIGLERHLELRDHVAAFLNLPGVVQLEEDVAWTVEDLIELMNLGAFRDKFVRELSTGSRRIVDLAMCIAHDPKVLLLDEPSSGIAQRETEALGPLLRRIQDETGCALLVIEHDMPLITDISDRMIALELGTPIVEGTPEEVISNPQVISSYLGGDLTVINRSGTSSNGERAGKSQAGRVPSSNGNGRRAQPLRARDQSGRRS